MLSKPWKLTIPNTDSVSRVSEESVTEKKIYTSVLYIKGTSERLQRAFKSHEVTLFHTPFNSYQLVRIRVNDKTENIKKYGAVYHIHCEQCDKDYVGETSQLLETRVKEPLSRNSSAVHKHCNLTGHSVDSSKTKVLATENNTLKRHIREALEIRFRKPSLNRDNRDLKHHDGRGGRGRPLDEEGLVRVPVVNMTYLSLSNREPIGRERREIGSS